MPSEFKQGKSLVGNYTIPAELSRELENEFRKEDSVEDKDLRKNLLNNEYKQRKYNRANELDADVNNSYRSGIEERHLEREEERVKKAIEEKKRDPNAIKRQRKRRWDVGPEEIESTKKYAGANREVVLTEDQRQTLEVKDQIVKRERRLPMWAGIQLTNDLLDKIIPEGYTPVFAPHVDPGTVQEAGTALEDNYYIPPSKDLENIQTKKLVEEQLPTEIPRVKGLQFFKQEDMKHFGKLITSGDNLDQKEALVMKSLLKIKNGTPLTRKKALRQLTNNARNLGAGLLFNHILPILLEPNLDDRERHILVKLIGRVLFQLDDLIRPYTHKILVVVSPFLIDEDFTLRLEAREIISSLTKAAGMANIISNLRPDLDHSDEYVRNVTSRVFAIVANTLGLGNFLPFLKAVIKSKKNWAIRHTGIKIIQQLCILVGGGSGNSILPYLNQLIEIIRPGLSDEVLQVRTISALTLSQLAESVKPYGIESFESILEPAWVGLKNHRGRALAGFLKCIGSIIPLMCHDPNYEEYANYYTSELVSVITREFNSPDEDMKKSILRIMMNLPLSKSLIPEYDRQIIKPFLRYFWNRRIATDSLQLSKLVIDSTIHLAKSFDVLEMLDCLIIYTRDDNEFLRRMSVEAIGRIISNDPSSLIGLDSRLEISLVDGVLYAFQEQKVQHKSYLLCFNSLAVALGVKLKPHINSIISTILYRLKNKSSDVRLQAADLITIMAPCIKLCSSGDNEILAKLVYILYESLGEVFPEVLGSIINALYACIDNLDREYLYGMTNPSVNQILPTLTPILKNRQEKVQEACIKLVGLIASKNAETINAKEWMRICFELLDMLKSSKKRIRIAANETFGSIAKTIGPQDVLVMLLNNLRVQERQLRVCTAVAIGIVAETCAPFTVLPALMNEYRTPENNVQNGVLKALSFLFEYIDGKMTKDYLFAITPLIEDALTDRDHVHRQTAATVVKHMALNCFGSTSDAYYDVFVHFLNLLIPNIFETSPHVILRILESIDSLRVVVGIGTFSNYIWAGLFHPARKVRNSYWKIYNNAYVHSSDSMVPYYPDLDKIDDSGCKLEVPELDLII